VDLKKTRAQKEKECQTCKKEVVDLSLTSGGCIKFDIKSWNDSLHTALCGVSNYSLLAFYPQFFFKDLPVIPRDLAFRCKEVAEGEGLRRVKVGNLHLL